MVQPVLCIVATRSTKEGNTSKEHVFGGIRSVYMIVLSAESLPNSLWFSSIENFKFYFSL